MNLSPELLEKYTQEKLRARDAQRLAQFIAFGPAIFQTGRIMVKWGILQLLLDSEHGKTVEEVATEVNISVYAAKCLLEASLSIGIVLVDADTERFTISKAGWFLLTDPSTRVNMDFNHDVNYRGWYNLEESLKEGKPEGLKTLGEWPTVYEGLSKLAPQIQKSWLAFDHFYSDNSFSQALEIVFKDKPASLLDVGGNTGRWALRCVQHDSDVEITILDLPGQIRMMQANIQGQPGAERINGLGVDLLSPESKMPDGRKFDAVWMSQFLDCFSEEQIIAILRKTAQVMGPASRLFIMETLWDRQQYETSAMCLTLTSLYFTAIANGNSKMYSSDDMKRLVRQAGLEIEEIHDNLGWGHSILQVRKKER